MKPVFFHYRDKHNRPIVTMCVLYDGTNYGAGVSICSKQDNPCKRTGRAISYARAKAAMERKENLLPVYTKRAENIVKLAIGLKGPMETFPEYKILFDPQLTMTEKEIIGKALK